MRTLTRSSKSTTALSLDTPLIQLGPGATFTLAHACQGTQIFGGTGSGKTSGSGRALAHAFLRHGFGGLVLCAKPEESALWQRYAAETGRIASVLEIGPDAVWRFNFLDYILHKDGVQAANNAVNVLLRAAEASRLAQDRPAAEGAQFWEDATRQLLMSAVPLLYAAYGRVTLDELYRLVQSAPQSEQEAMSEAWQGGSFCYATLTAARADPLWPLDERTLMACAAYWRFDFARLDAKTRGNIVISLTSLLARFGHGRLHDLFCTQTTFVPDLCFEGAILILNMPVKSWQEDGIIAQHLIKFLWQRAVEARASRGGELRPVFLWADESQFFVNSYDPEFQSTARSARACTVYITQSLPTYYAKIGGQKPEHYTDMLLANLITRIFHANGCQVTNRWAADAIGQGIVLRSSANWGSSNGGSRSSSRGLSGGTNSSRGGGSSSSSGPGGSSYGGQSSWSSGANEGWNRGFQKGTSWSDNEGESLQEQKDYKVDPSLFATRLRSGGASFNGRVDAVWVQPGRQFPRTGDIYTPITFLQEGAR